MPLNTRKFATPKNSARVYFFCYKSLIPRGLPRNREIRARSAVLPFSACENADPVTADRKSGTYILIEDARLRHMHEKIGIISGGEEGHQKVIKCQRRKAVSRRHMYMGQVHDRGHPSFIKNIISCDRPVVDMANG